MKPLVSIIMNCKNGEKYLEESIESVINQTYENWELIFVDNASNDNSKSIFFSFKDHRLKYFFFRKWSKFRYGQTSRFKKLFWRLYIFFRHR